MTSCPAPTLIVVGDDSSFRYLIERYAKKSACHVVFVPPADDVPAAVLREAPGVVLVELGIPDERGKRVLHALKSHPDTREVPMIICSWMDEGEWGLDEGAAIYMQKPILYDDFHAVLMGIASLGQS